MAPAPPAPARTAPTRPPAVLWGLGLVALCVAGGLAQPGATAALARSVTGLALGGGQAWWMGLALALLLLAGWAALGPQGRRVLGPPGARPEHGTLSWLAMLFACGMGSGLLFWGVAEPLTHGTMPPPGAAPMTPAQALAITHFHWGLHAWAIYAIAGLAIAWFSHAEGRPAAMSAPVRALVPGRAGRGLGALADVLGVLAVVFGVAGTLAMGTLQLSGGLGLAAGVAAGPGLSAMLLGALFVAYGLSSMSGVRRGIRWLSLLNLALALLLLGFVLAWGPPVGRTAADGVAAYMAAFVPWSLEWTAGAERRVWLVDWTLTYLVWWIAWAPFVGVFIARISRGRTVRAFVGGVVLVPVVASILWFSALGGGALVLEARMPGSLSGPMEGDVARALFAFLALLPRPELTAWLAMALLFAFLVTSADSGAYVLAMLGRGGEPEPPPAERLAWGLLLAGLAAVILAAGTVEVARAFAILGAIPFSAVLALHALALARALGRAPAPATPAARPRSVAP